jgi:hypothetical protein
MGRTPVEAIAAVITSHKYAARVSFLLKRVDLAADA